MNPWDRFLHWLWCRVGEPGMQYHGPYVEPGSSVSVRWIEIWGTDERTGIVSSVATDDFRVTQIVLREAS